MSRDLPSVPPEQVVQILCRDPLGAALWRAAAAEAVANALAERVEQLEQQHGGAPQPAAEPQPFTAPEMH